MNNIGKYIFALLVGLSIFSSSLYAFNVGVDSQYDQSKYYQTDVTGTFTLSPGEFTARYSNWSNWAFSDGTPGIGTCGNVERYKNYQGCYNGDGSPVANSLCENPAARFYEYDNLGLCIIGTWGPGIASCDTTTCGRSAYTGSIDAVCSTGDDLDCDPNIQPAATITTCSATVSCYAGSWTANSAPSCPTACGYAGGSTTGTVTCQGGECDPYGIKPTAKTRSCNATGVCYAGSWTANSAPSCPTACDYAGGSTTGTVTCSGGTCDPGSKPLAITRSCRATSACITFDCPAKNFTRRYKTRTQTHSMPNGDNSQKERRVDIYASNTGCCLQSNTNGCTEPGEGVAEYECRANVWQFQGTVCNNR